MPSTRRSARRRPGLAGRDGGGPTPGSAADELPDADPESVARAICLRQLTLAPRTRAQLAEKLHERGVPEEAAERVLDRFAEVGLVDDAAYAEAWVRSRHSGRGLARRALAHELRGRGVADETVAEAVERLAPEEELETARALVARRLPGTHGLSPEARTRRLAGMLARKGYPAGVVWRVVGEAVAADVDGAESNRDAGGGDTFPQP